MIGILLGLVFGSLQLYLLMLAVGSIGTSKLKIWPLAVQFFCPFAGLLLCALARRDQLVICAVTMSVVLIAGAVIRFVRVRARDKNGKKD